MKERLLQLLDLEQLSSSKFADTIGVQRSSVSHVISGRNKPSFDFLQKTLGAFPGLSAAWLMMGKGTMYEQMGSTTPGNLFNPVNTASENTFPDDISDIGEKVEQTDPSEPHSSNEAKVPAETESNIAAEALAAAKVSGSKKRIVQVMVIYEDDTFKAFSPVH